MSPKLCLVRRSQGLGFGTMTIAPPSIFHPASPVRTGSQASSDLPSKSTIASDGGRPAGAETTGGTGSQTSVSSLAGRSAADANGTVAKNAQRRNEIGVMMWLEI